MAFLDMYIAIGIIYNVLININLINYLHLLTFEFRFWDMLDPRISVNPI